MVDEKSVRKEADAWAKAWMRDETGIYEARVRRKSHMGAVTDAPRGCRVGK
jgi:hypothetical protein